MGFRVFPSKDLSMIALDRWLLTTALVVLSLASVGISPSAAQDSPQPRLAVALVVDQLRPDLLERYDQAFTGGLRRLLDEGFRFTQASQIGRAHV
mgnify:CR=1 FL=1